VDKVQCQLRSMVYPFGSLRYVIRKQTVRAGLSRRWGYTGNAVAFVRLSWQMK
jgi:hypothetical protein